jgi:hypothetical protein
MNKGIYKTASFFQNSNIKLPSRKIEYELYNIGKKDPEGKNLIIENFEYNTSSLENFSHNIINEVLPLERYTLDSNGNNTQKINSNLYEGFDENINLENHNHKKILSAKWEKKMCSLTDPNVWGPALWFTLHNGAIRYPIHANKIIEKRMKGFILGLPLMLPCIECRIHATAFIQKHEHQLHNICSGKDHLFNFFVDMHNKVNKRYNKPEYSYKEARELYSGNAEITCLKYTEKSSENILKEIFM